MKLNLMKKTLMAAALTAAFIGVSCETKKTKQIALLYDQSKSKIDGCDCLTGVLEKTLKDNSSTGAKITFFKLGELNTGFEPKVVAVYDLQKNRRVTEGKSEAIEKQKEIIADFQTKCRSIARTDDTPLAQAISKIVSFLKQNGCDEKLGCQAIVQTDLQESVPNVSQQKTIEQISNNEIKFDNVGIAVTFYGVAEVEENASKTPKEINKIISNAKSRDTLKNVWKQKFVDQNLIRFFDFCTFESSPEIVTKQE
jgi:hypothetical protein